jgi:acyl-CoA thioester hydrolase
LDSQNYPTSKFRIFYEDTDVSGFVYHSKYFNFCERARSEIFFKLGLSPINNNLHFVVSEIRNAKFLKSAKFGEILTIKTQTLNLKKCSVFLNQTIFRNDEKLFEMEILLAHLQGEKIAKIPEEIAKLFQ